MRDVKKVFTIDKCLDTLDGVAGNGPTPDHTDARVHATRYRLFNGNPEVRRAVKFNDVHQGRIDIQIIPLSRRPQVIEGLRPVAQAHCKRIFVSRRVIWLHAPMSEAVSHARPVEVTTPELIAIVTPNPGPFRVSIRSAKPNEGGIGAICCQGLLKLLLGQMIHHCVQYRCILPG